jgi:hypothetical protein
MFTSTGNRIRGLASISSRKLSVSMAVLPPRMRVVAASWVPMRRNLLCLDDLWCSSGVHIQQGASRNYVGGTSPADRNVLSATHTMALRLVTTTDANVRHQHLIGLSPAGDRRVPIATMCRHQFHLTLQCDWWHHSANAMSCRAMVMRGSSSRMGLATTKRLATFIGTT